MRPYDRERTAGQHQVRLVAWGRNGTRVVCQARADLYPLGATNRTWVTIYGAGHAEAAAHARLLFAAGASWGDVVAGLRAARGLTLTH